MSLMALMLLGFVVTLVVPHTLPASTVTPQALQLPEVKVSTQPDIIAIDPAQPATVSLSVQIPSDHHGYLDRGDEGFLIPCQFSFTPLETRGIHVTPLSRPTGERDDTVHATVFRGTGTFLFRFATQDFTGPMSETLAGTLQYQICNDRTNLCYPPQEALIPFHFSLPSSAVPSPTLNERITALFRRYTTNLVFACGLIFIAGLLATATPCVYPMLPLTSAFLTARGHGSAWQGALHVLLYCCGMVFFYLLLGIVAATTGTALSSIMTSAWANLGFAALFTYFGFSMLGFYDFQFFIATLTQLDNASSLVRGLPGSFLMGTMVGLIVSPCVGPVTGAILLDITQQTATMGLSAEPIRLAQLSRGTLMMTSFGAGLAVPFLLVGTVSHRLPQSGAWLRTTKFLLGLPILYVAYTYYLKGMETAGIASNVTHAILLGMLAIVGGVFLGALQTLRDKPSSPMLLRRALGIICLVIGIHFLYNGIGQSGILLGPSPMPLTGDKGNPQKAVGPHESAEKSGNLFWWRDFALAQQRSQAENKPLFVDFYAAWCTNCKAFQALTLSNVALNEALSNAILVKIYDTDSDFSTFQKNPQYPELRGIKGQPLLPLFAIYSPQGILTWKGQDYQAVHTMVTQLTSAQNHQTP